MAAGDLDDLRKEEAWQRKEASEGFVWTGPTRIILVRSSRLGLPILREGRSQLLSENPEALFRSWLIEHRGAVLKVARAYTLTTEDCQDLVQEILLQVWRSLPRFQGRAAASTWFYRVALNTALDWRRKEHRRQTRQQPILEVQDLSVVGLDSAEQVVQREVVERLYAAIRQLPKTDAALVLLYLDDLSYRQIAEVLGISESNVGVKLNRAKKALGELMNEESHES
jgi:RNA polymerase sigma-70 factor, ECF subfamily